MNPSIFSSPRVHYVFGSTSPMVLHPAVHHSQSSCQWYHSCVYLVPKPNLYFILMDNIIHGSWKAGKGWENSSRELMSVRHGLREETMQSVQELLVHFIICLRALIPDPGHLGLLHFVQLAYLPQMVLVSISSCSHSKWIFTIHNCFKALLNEYVHVKYSWSVSPS